MRLSTISVLMYEEMRESISWMLKIVGISHPIHKNEREVKNMKARLVEPGTRGMKVEPMAHCENPGEKPHCDIYG